VIACADMENVYNRTSGIIKESDCASYQCVCESRSCPCTDAETQHRGRGGSVVLHIPLSDISWHQRTMCFREYSVPLQSWEMCLKRLFPSPFPVQFFPSYSIFCVTFFSNILTLSIIINYSSPSCLVLSLSLQHLFCLIAFLSSSD